MFHPASYWQHINPTRNKNSKLRAFKDFLSFWNDFELFKNKCFSLLLNLEWTNLCMWRISTLKGTDFPSSSIISPWPNLQRRLSWNHQNTKCRHILWKNRKHMPQFLKSPYPSCKNNNNNNKTMLWNTVQPNVGRSSLHSSLVCHQAGTYPGLKQLGVLLLPPSLRPNWMRC